jgi:hypothetical protein
LSYAVVRIDALERARLAEAGWWRPVRRTLGLTAVGANAYAAHGGLNYQLACFHALAGDTDEAARHLRVAFEADPRTRAWAEDDRDLDGVPRP